MGTPRSPPAYAFPPHRWKALLEFDGPPNRGYSMTREHNEHYDAQKTDRDGVRSSKSCDRYRHSLCVAGESRRTGSKGVRRSATGKLDRAGKSARRFFYRLSRAKELCTRDSAVAIRDSRLRRQSISAVRERRAGFVRTSAVGCNALALRDGGSRPAAAPRTQRDLCTRLELGLGTTRRAAHSSHRIPHPG